MAFDQNRVSRAFSFLLDNGGEIYPVKIRRRDTGAEAFRISRGGTGGNTLEAGSEVDESTMVNKVLNQGYAVRCASLDGSIQGLYRVEGRSVRAVRRS